MIIRSTTVQGGEFPVGTFYTSNGTITEIGVGAITSVTQWRITTIGGEPTTTNVQYVRTPSPITETVFHSFSTSPQPRLLVTGVLSFNTYNTSIPSATVISVGTKTVLTSTFGITSTKNSFVTNYKTLTTAIDTISRPVYSTRLFQYGNNTYVNTKYDLFDNGDNKSVFKLVAGNGGIPSYEILQEGYVVGEMKRIIEAGEVVTTANTYVIEPLPTVGKTETWYKEITYTSTTRNIEEYYDEAAEEWKTQYGDSYEATLYSFSTVTIYSVTKTVNRVSVGTTPNLNTWGSTEVDGVLTTSSYSDVDYAGEIVISTQAVAKDYKDTLTITKYIDQGAFIAEKMFLYLTVRTKTKIANTTSVYSATRLSGRVPTTRVTEGSYAANYLNTYIGVTGNDGYTPPIISGDLIDNFFLEPVGSPCIGGINRSGDYLELDDNCPHAFPASMLWQGAFDSSHAAPSASSFYGGGVPLISHPETWEHDSRTYGWITANGTEGKLKVSGEENSTSTSSTTFTIKVAQDCSYTGANLTTQAGGKYFSSRQATLVANSPLIVSIRGGTKSFGKGLHEITEPMRIVSHLPYGSVLASGIVALGPTYTHIVSIDRFSL